MSTQCSFLQGNIQGVFLTGTKKLIQARLGVSWPIYVNVDSPNLGFTFQGVPLKKTPCIFTTHNCTNRCLEYIKQHTNITKDKRQHKKFICPPKKLIRNQCNFTRVAKHQLTIHTKAVHLHDKGGNHERREDTMMIVCFLVLTVSQNTNRNTKTK